MKQVEDVILLKTQARAGNQSAPGLEAGPEAQGPALHVGQGMQGQVGGQQAGGGTCVVRHGGLISVPFSLQDDVAKMENCRDCPQHG